MELTLSVAALAAVLGFALLRPRRQAPVAMAAAAAAQTPMPVSLRASHPAASAPKHATASAKSNSPAAAKYIAADVPITNA